jgi:cytidine deaminase
LSEFCDDQFRIILAKNINETKTFSLGQLFPMRFSYTKKDKT